MFYLSHSLLPSIKIHAIIPLKLIFSYRGIAFSFTNNFFFSVMRIKLSFWIENSILLDSKFHVYKREKSKMFVLKSVLYVAVIMGTCMLFAFPQCCRGETFHCLLCLEIAEREYDVDRPFRICDNCYRDCERLTEKLHENYYPSSQEDERQLLSGATGVTHTHSRAECALLSAPITPPRSMCLEQEHSTPVVRVFADYMEVSCLEHWCPDAVATLMRHFIDEPNGCDRESLLGFITAIMVDARSPGCAQAYMGGCILL